LSRSPYLLTFEEDGKSAVERFATEDFDLILMDVQMPVMDGLAAIRAIRKLEQERGVPPIPILALTANATVQDIDKSRIAGCNAHLSKPISKIQLLRAIETYARPRRALTIMQPEFLEPINIRIPHGFEQITPGFLASRREQVPELLKLLAASDFERLTTLGHDLKGCSGGYGFPHLGQLGAALEQLAIQKNGSALATHIADLSNYLDRVRLIAIE
jgi:CheY-like chemotaxis protein